MSPRVLIVASFIRDNLPREIPLAELANHVNLSPSRLRQLFKKEIGQTPAQYLNALRLEKAKEMLEDTFLSVKEIRFKVGAKDKSRFAKDFRKAYGLTPVQYREKYLREKFNGTSDLFV
jgi:transcriptional regulator GlxA family with amidase domain